MFFFLPGHCTSKRETFLNTDLALNHVEMREKKRFMDEGERDGVAVMT